MNKQFMLRSSIANGRFENKFTYYIALLVLVILVVSDYNAFAQTGYAGEGGWYENDDFSGIVTLDSAIISDTNILVMTEHKIFYSDNISSGYEEVYITVASLNAMKATENITIAVGDNGFAVKSSGSDFSEIDFGVVVSSDLLGVSIYESNIWIVGTGGTIMHSNNSGVNWSDQSYFENIQLNDGDFMNSSHGWLVGDGGLILYTTDSGLNWASVNSGASTDLNAIDVETSEQNRIWIVGDFGVFLFSWGSSFGIRFDLKDTGVTADLYDIFSPSFGVFWIAGDNYTLLGSQNQGTDFILQTLPDTGTGYFTSVKMMDGKGIVTGTSTFNTIINGSFYVDPSDIDPWQDIGFYSRSVIPRLLGGMVRALQVVLIALLIGFALGLLMATFRTLSNRFLNIVATAYSDLFRNTPLLVQLTFIAFGLPEIGFNPPVFWDAVIALSLNTGAYQSEIIRSGILAIPKGQMEAARSLGMTNAQAMRHIILPQAVRITIPPLANESVNMFLNSSLLSVIGFMDITRVGNIVAIQSFLWARTFLYVAVTYFIITYTFTTILRKVEKKLKIPGLGGGEI